MTGGYCVYKFVCRGVGGALVAAVDAALCYRIPPLKSRDGLTEGNYTAVLASYLPGLDAHTSLHKFFSSLRMSLLNKA